MSEATGVIRARAFEVCEPHEIARLLAGVSKARLVLDKDGKPEIHYWP